MPAHPDTSPVIVVGAGAAGILAGIFAARGGAPVVVLETRAQPGAKIRVSGGGRCNVLPSSVAPTDFHTSGSRHSLRNVVLSWPLASVHEFFESDLGVPLKRESTGKVFPQSDSSREVVAALLGALRRSGAQLRSPFRVAQIRRGDEGGFVVTSDAGESLVCRRLVLATGGLSLPKSGSDGAGLALAVAMGHTSVPTYPALVPLLSREKKWSALSGVSVPVCIRVERNGKAVETRSGDMLFTHRGFSGPVVLDVSHWVTRDNDATLVVNWGALDDWDAELRAPGRATAASALRRRLPERLAGALLGTARIDPSRRLGELARGDRQRLARILGRFVLPVAGSEGYRTAEVTGGGIPLAEVAPATLESRVIPGMYLCGEILDATGRLGGYNFLWAWVTGRKVGNALAAVQAAA